MIGIIARGYLKNTVEVDSLLLSLAAKYGYMCLFTKSLHDDKTLLGAPMTGQFSFTSKPRMKE